MSSERPRIPIQKLLLTIDGGTGSGHMELACALSRVCGTHVLDTGTSVRALTDHAWKTHLIRFGETGEDPVVFHGDGKEKILDWFAHKETRPRIVTGPFSDGRAHVVVGAEDVTARLNMLVRPDIHKQIEYGARLLAADPDIRAKFYMHWESAINRWKHHGVIVGRRTGVDLCPERHASMFLAVDPHLAAKRRVALHISAWSTVPAETRYVKQRDQLDGAKGFLAREPDALVIDMTEPLKEGNMLPVIDMVFDHLAKRYDVQS